MKAWKTCLIAQVMVLVCDRIGVSGQSNDFLATNARTIDDLYYVLGPNYKLFVAAYWRYLMASCDVAGMKMTQDVESGVMDRYCNYLTECPIKASTQSCIVQVSADAILKACCTGAKQGPDNITTQAPTPRTTVPSVYIPTTFDPVAQAACLYGRVLPTEKIIGGSPSFKGEFPWIAMLLRDGRFLCSCIIADATHVLTAAHCFDTHRDFYEYEVIAGKFKLNLTETEMSEQRKRVTSFVRHEFYSSLQMSNDIAILELASPLQWTDYIQPACFPSPEAQLEEYCTVAGWGYTNLSVSRMSLDMMKVDLQAYTKDECYNTFRNTLEGDIDFLLHDGSICAANSLLGGKDACKGDSGSPLMCEQSTQVSAAYFVYGIVSNGNQCALPGEPGFYTNVQYYLNWIQETINSM